MALDYYLILGEDGRLQALLVEEFVHRPDFTAAALDSAVFDGAWWSSAEFSRSLRTDARLSARVTPTSRAGAEAVYGELGGDLLPDDDALRTRFHDRSTFPDVAPLRLGSEDARRVYRVLFARDLDERRLGQLCGALQLSPVDDPRVAGRATQPDLAMWELRRVGGVAWSVDVTFPGEVSGDLLRDLIATVRGHGLIPVTVERFA
jgi:hypothetical protein